MPGTRGRSGQQFMPAQDIYEESVDKMHRLGSRLPLGDRVFYYAKATEALSPGKLATVARDQDAEDTVTIAHAIGTTVVTVTAASAITANQYADGMLCIDEGTGVGQSYKIKGHPAIGSAETGLVELYDGLATAWVIANTDITLYTSIFTAQESNADQIECPLGVSPIAVQSGYYFWCQTWGPVLCLCDLAEGNATDQRALTIGDTTDGAVEAMDAIGEPYVGQMLTDAADVKDADDYDQILLQIMA